MRKFLEAPFALLALLSLSIKLWFCRSVSIVIAPFCPFLAVFWTIKNLRFSICHELPKQNETTMSTGAEQQDVLDMAWSTLVAQPGLTARIPQENRPTVLLARWVVWASSGDLVRRFRSSLSTREALVTAPKTTTKQDVMTTCAFLGLFESIHTQKCLGGFGEQSCFVVKYTHGESCTLCHGVDFEGILFESNAYQHDIARS